ncbi:MAG TPA: succinylglutamate desuccinylase, partial [Acidobacteriota bacterium]|nr:succinylglutamate desuccinylase [Acidobacteriota bacterium]
MIRKIGVAALGAALAVAAGLSFHRSRRLPEPVVAGPSLARVVKLGDYFAPIKGTTNDANVYVLEGKEPGGTVVLLGGTHPEEPAGRLAAWIFAENAVVERGRLLVIL